MSDKIIKTNISGLKAIVLTIEPNGKVRVSAGVRDIDYSTDKLIE